MGICRVRLQPRVRNVHARHHRWHATTGERRQVRVRVSHESESERLRVYRVRKAVVRVCSCDATHFVRRAIMPTLLSATRREVLTAAAAMVPGFLLGQRAAAREASSARVPAGPGSVAGAPHLPAGFAKTFASRYVDANGLRLHTVVGGNGRPVLLVHGWPQTWYQWRLVMPTLARDFNVIAVDQRGIGLSDKPESGYDAGAQANDMVALMDALGHRRFAMVGFDTGMPIAYALAADHPQRLERLVVGEAVITGVTPSPPLL